MLKIINLLIIFVFCSLISAEPAISKPKQKYFAVLAYQDDYVRQTLYIKKKTSIKLDFKFVTEDIITKKKLFILEGIARITNLNEPRYSVVDECDRFGESEYGADGYDFISKKRGIYYYKCTYTIFVCPNNCLATVVGDADCAYVPPPTPPGCGMGLLCNGTLRRIE